MCTRYWIYITEDMMSIIEEMKRSPLVERWSKTTEIKTSGEVRPTDVVPVIASNKAGRRAVFPMKWGFAGKTLLLNARSETAAEKPTFRDAWNSHRCIVPASWYFEWEHLNGSGRAGESGKAISSGKAAVGDKYSIHPRGSEMTWLCGLYRIENGLPTFVVLTREPSDELRFIHDRMPLIMPDSLVNEWIRPDAKPADLLKHAVTDMVYEKADVQSGQITLF